MAAIAIFLISGLWVQNSFRILWVYAEACVCGGGGRLGGLPRQAPVFGSFSGGIIWEGAS